ncbi:MAG: DUF6665 family protein [Devosia sp.]
MPISLADIAALRQALNSGFGPVENEILAEKASALGHHGRLAERAVAALHAFDAAPEPGVDRLSLVKAAAREVWKYFIQRELCGLRDQREVIREYRIPSEVLMRLGAMD